LKIASFQVVTTFVMKMTETTKLPIAINDKVEERQRCNEVDATGYVVN